MTGISFYLREECTDFYYSASCQVVTFFSFVVREALSETFCFIAV